MTALSAVPVLDDLDLALVDALGAGLPLTHRPYADLGIALGLSEAAVLSRLTRLQETGVIRRFGAIVRHREVGYRANAMCVFDIADDRVAGAGALLAARPEVTLCYRRRRQRPEWPYNLFAMVHGKQRDEVSARIARMIRDCGLEAVPRAVLFGVRRFKQGGGCYGRPRDASPAEVRP